MPPLYAIPRAHTHTNTLARQSGLGETGKTSRKIKEGDTIVVLLGFGLKYNTSDNKYSFKNMSLIVTDDHKKPPVQGKHKLIGNLSP